MLWGCRVRTHLHWVTDDKAISIFLLLTERNHLFHPPPPVPPHLPPPPPQSGRFHDAIKSSQMSVEMVRDKSEKLARDSRVPSQLPWACRVDAATARVVKARALIALQR